VLVDFISLMRRSARARGKLRPDLLAALQGLAPPFIRWPGGSYASIYKWKDGIGPAVSRKYNPNTIWGYLTTRLRHGRVLSCAGSWGRRP
jgi:alpha-N-arabinofuranosidase